MFYLLYSINFVLHITAMMIAGHTADYVNTVLQKVADGDRTGGLLLDD